MELNDIQIREANTSDFDDVVKVEKRAFGEDEEAELVENLLNDLSAQPVLSLLAFAKEKAVGHILFTKASINGNNDAPLTYILAPLAVVPEFQKQGIGGLLIREGLKKLKREGVELVFVLGHMEYYPKHGFIPNAESAGFPAPYPIPEEHANAWMIQYLTAKELIKTTGKVFCANALDRPEYWRE